MVFGIFFPRLQKRKRCSGVPFPSSNLSCLHKPWWMDDSLLPSPIKAPVFLSQPGMAINPSYHCAPITVSMESAITSRETNEKRIQRPFRFEIVAYANGIKNQSHQIGIPYPFDIFGQIIQVHIASIAPSYQCWQYRFELFQISSVKPIPYNIACAAGCVMSWVMVLYLFNSIFCL